MSYYKLIYDRLYLIGLNLFLFSAMIKTCILGFALLNSPAGLAAYILEKFSTWTNDKFRLLEDGGLTNKFTMDELLTNVMVYYSSGSIVSSQRYYKENVSSHLTRQLFK